MKLEELFKGILDCHKGLQSEYRDFLRYCSKATGVECSPPKTREDWRMELVYYVLRRNIVLARATKGQKKKGTNK